MSCPQQSTPLQTCIKLSTTGTHPVPLSIGLGGGEAAALYKKKIPVIVIMSIYFAATELLIQHSLHIPLPNAQGANIQ